MQVEAIRSRKTRMCRSVCRHHCGRSSTETLETKKLNRKLRHLALGVCLFASLSGCKQSSVDSLEGEYGVAEHGKIDPAVKVEKTDKGYVFDNYEGGRWHTATEIARPITPEEFEKIMGVKPQGSFVGYAAGLAIVAKVQPGLSVGDFKTSTGYMMLLPGGPIELTKM